MKPNQAATLAARLVGILTLGWVYLAYTDLRWLLHIHAVHFRITRAPLAFSYYPYLTCNIANVAAAIITTCLLLFLPSWLLRALTPASKKSCSLSALLFTAGILVGLIMLVFSVQTILATALWTIYSSGKNSGWQIELFVSALVAVGGIFLCRRILAGSNSHPSFGLTPPAACCKAR